MDNKNVQDFLNSLTEEQRTAVFACKTEEDLEKVVDEYDIDLPDEMLADVAGGKGRLLPALMAGIMALSGGALTAGSVTASAAGYHPPVYLVEEYDSAETEARLKKCIADMVAEMQRLIPDADPNVVKDIKIPFYGTQIEIGKIARIVAENNNLLTIEPMDMSILSDIETAVREANTGGEIKNNGKMILIEFHRFDRYDKYYDALVDIEESALYSIRDICCNGDMKFMYDYEMMVHDKYFEYLDKASGLFLHI